MPEGTSRRDAAPTEIDDPRRAWVEIDLGALTRNYRALAAHVAPSRVLAVVKADAYGHGAIEVARALEPEGVAGFGVATLREGVELRAAGIEAPVQVLSPVPDDAFAQLVRHRLTPVVSSLRQLDLLAARSGAEDATLPIHLKFDSGMTRLGIDLADAGEAFDRVAKVSTLRLEGVLSHLAEAETPGARSNGEQIARFQALLALHSGRSATPVVRHLANSAAALHLPQTRLDQVRLGISLYGYDSASWDAPALPLEPVMSVRAEIVQVRDVAAGRKVGYGGRFEAARPSRIAIVPLGYADGYSWRLGARAEVLLGARRTRVAGSVSMDLTAIDATDRGAEVGDEVTLLGVRGDERISAAELATLVGSIPYQLLCLFGLRLPRRFVRGAGSARP